MNKSKDDTTTWQAQIEKPESFQGFENFVRAVFAVPKAEVDALEQEEKCKQVEPKPAK